MCECGKDLNAPCTLSSTCQYVLCEDGRMKVHDASSEGGYKCVPQECTPGNEHHANQYCNKHGRGLSWPVAGAGAVRPSLTRKVAHGTCLAPCKCTYEGEGASCTYDDETCQATHCDHGSVSVLGEGRLSIPFFHMRLGLTHSAMVLSRSCRYALVEKGTSFVCEKARRGTPGGVVALLCFLMMGLGAGMLVGYQRYKDRYVQASGYILDDNQAYDDFR
eukprot:scaffold2119_cov355-Prasinococcus_capsulatus_cf.AAC.13